MPNATTRASAQAMPVDRRLFLAAGTAAAVFGAIRTAARPLDALIEAHQSAWRAFEAICSIEDDLSDSDPEFPAIHAQWRRLSEIEADALTALCAFRPATMQEVHRRGDYLADFFSEKEIRPDVVTLIDSLRSPGACPGAAFRRDV